MPTHLLGQTAKASGVEPHAYLSHLFEKVPYAKGVEDFEALLPWNVKHALPTSQIFRGFCIINRLRKATCHP